MRSTAADFCDRDLVEPGDQRRGRVSSAQFFMQSPSPRKDLPIIEKANRVKLGALDKYNTPLFAQWKHFGIDNLIELDSVNPDFSMESRAHHK